MNNNSVEQPDPDNIKMFVGQVPHDMDENDLRTLFEEFGRVHQINVLRDKTTGSSKGKGIIQQIVRACYSFSAHCMVYRLIVGSVIFVDDK